ncbi:MAG: hypothetical protein K6F30_06110 [Lachnospiraceae bacterium]|nr:hypothetical protein [Lachnospiraceae bacterium]
MSRVKKEVKRILAGVLCGVVLFSSNAMTSLYNNTDFDFYNNEIVSMAEVDAASTFTIKKANVSTAKKLDKKLKKNKAITLKIKGSGSSTRKKIVKLQNIIKGVNGQGIIFQTSGLTQSGGYCYYTISSSDAKTYSYGVKFIERLLTCMKTGMCPGSGNTFNGYTEAQIYWKLYVSYVSSGSTLSFPQYIAFLNEQYLSGEYFDMGDNDSIYSLAHNCGNETLASIYYVVYNTNNFNDLSDALKVWTIAKSGYFGCSFQRKGYNMTYSYTYEAKYGGAAMKTLYENKATGVCQVHATYENIVWRALGITSYYNSSNYINHAWTVVKVKNSMGKTLWIPFDYGIGPSDSLAVSDDVREKYLKTEEMRYALYLNGIKGAPSVKNFTELDFN